MIGVVNTVYFPMKVASQSTLYPTYSLPEVFNKGQYLQLFFLWQSLVSDNGSFNSSERLVEALTNWSDRFLFLRRPNMILASSSGLVVLVLPRISQFFEIMSLSGGLFGLCVVTQ